MTIKVIGKKSGADAEVETNTLALRAVFRPRDMQMRGAYQAGLSVSAASGFGLTNTSLYGSGPYCLVKKLIFSAGVVASAAANIETITLTYRRNIVTTGSYTPLLNKLRSTFPDPVMTINSSFGGTADPKNIWSSTLSIPAVAGSRVHAPLDLLDFTPDRFLIIEPGHQVANGVTLTTNVTLSVTVYWEEYDLIG